MRYSFKIAAAVLLCYLFINACNNEATETTATTPTAPSAEDNIKEGQRLVAALDCEICHSPKRMGPKGPEIIPELRFGGHHQPDDWPHHSALWAIALHCGQHVKTTAWPAD